MFRKFLFALSFLASSVSLAEAQNYGPTVYHIASMQLLSSMKASTMAQYGTLYLDGFYEGNTSGGGTFTWLTAAQASGLTPDGGVVIAPSDHTADCSDGCLVRQNYITGISLSDFGPKCDGTSDDTTAVQNWATAVAHFNTPGTAYTACSALVSASIVFDPKIDWNLAGLQLIPSASLTSGCLATFGGTQPGYTGIYNGQLNGLRLWQPLITSSGNMHADPSKNLDGLCLGTTASGEGSYQIGLGNLNIQGFRNAVDIVGPNSYIIDFTNPNIGNLWEYGIFADASSNSGEHIDISGGSFYNINNSSFEGTAIWSSLNPFDFYLSNVSLDYNDIDAFIQGSTLNLVNVHDESNNNLPRVQLSRTGSGVNCSQLSITGGFMGHGSGTLNWTGISAEAANGRPSWITTDGCSSVTVTGTHVGAYYSSDQASELVTITDANAAEPERVINLSPTDFSTSTFRSGAPLVNSYWLNQLYYNRTDTTGWTANGTTFTWSTAANNPPDTGSFTATVSSATTVSLVQQIPVVAGRHITLRGYIQTPTLTAGSCHIRRQYYEKDGTTLVPGEDQTSTQGPSSAGTTWVLAWFSETVPAGAAFLTYSLYCPSFAGTVNFSDPYVGQPH